MLWTLFKTTKSWLTIIKIKRDWIESHEIGIFIFSIMQVITCYYLSVTIVKDDLYGIVNFPPEIWRYFWTKLGGKNYPSKLSGHNHLALILSSWEALHHNFTTIFLVEKLDFVFDFFYSILSIIDSMVNFKVTLRGRIIHL